MSHMSGGEVPFIYHVSKDPIILAGYLAIIISFLMSLFESKPKQLVFGTNNLQNLSFVHGEEYFLAIDAPFSHLALDKEFHEEFFEMDEKVLNDLDDNLLKKLIEEIFAIQAQKYEVMEVRALLKKNIEVLSKYMKDDKEKTQIFKKSLLGRIFGRL
ncbi:MAG: hypothetical protein ACW964_17225 [Candidatus Hodarchaeales archaeon]